MATLPNESELREVVEQVWSSFLDDALVPELTVSSADRHHSDRIVAWVSISGEWTGHLLVTTSAVGARAIAAGMFQLEPNEVDTAEIADALGEIANMIGGTVKGVVGAGAALSLPQVVLDAAALISLNALERVTVCARWKGELLEVSLWERQAHKFGGTK